MTDSRPRLKSSNDFVHMEFSPTERKDAFHKQKIVFIYFFIFVHHLLILFGNYMNLAPFSYHIETNERQTQEKKRTID